MSAFEPTDGVLVPHTVTAPGRRPSTDVLRFVVTLMRGD